MSGRVPGFRLEFLNQGKKKKIDWCWVIEKPQFLSQVITAHVPQPWFSGSGRLLVGESERELPHLSRCISLQTVVVLCPDVTSETGPIALV